jgi:hypothetical protein
VRHIAWILLGWLGVSFWSAVGARICVGHIIPDAALVTIVFLALRREPIQVALSALVLGYLVGRQALSPLGLHETALMACGLSVYVASGHIAGSGALFFAAASAVATLVHHVLLLVLTMTIYGHVGFSSWATALLLPSALATGLLAWLSHPWMIRLEKRLTPEVREGLTWR